MNIITEPTVEVIGYTVFSEHSKYRIPPDGDNATRLCAFAAKGCYDSFGETGRSNTENQAGIIHSKHGSVLEHYNITLFIEGITRGCSHEIVRHRAGFAYSQRSTRYTAEEDASFVLEPFFAKLWNKYLPEIESRHSDIGWNGYLGNPDKGWLWTGSSANQEKMLLADHINSGAEEFRRYRRQVGELIELNPEMLSGTALRKWARGKARNVLPHALETRMTITGNLRAWRHFLEMRSNRGAEAEIRRLSAAIAEVIFPIAPDHFADYTGEIVSGYPEFVTEHGKV